MASRNELNRYLAALMGWSNFENAGNALLGSPPWWAGNSRGQAQVPDWEGSWLHAGPLMTTHHCVPILTYDKLYGNVVEAFTPPAHRRIAVFVSDFATLDDAYRAAIIKAVALKLDTGSRAA